MKTESKHQLPEKTDESEYAFVLKKLGGSQFLLKLHLQNKEVVGKLCGKMRKGSNKKSNWVDVGSVVLVGLRSFEDKKVDILYTYTPEEVNKLKKRGELVENVDTVVDKQEEEPLEAFDFQDL